MTQDTRSDSSPPEGRPHDKLATALILVGLAGIVWGVLHLSSAGYGGQVAGRDFSQRRPYNQVKSDVHSAFPGALLRAGLGGLLVFAGMRRRALRGAVSPPLE